MPCSRSWRSARKRSARSWDWPTTAPSTTTASARSTAATPSVTRPSCRPSSSRRSACSLATATARATCAACWSSRPRSWRRSATRSRSRHRHGPPSSHSPNRSGVAAAAWILGILAVLLLVGAVVGGGYLYLRNQVPSSAVAATLPGGTDLSAELAQPVGPEGGSQSLSARAAIGARRRRPGHHPGLRPRPLGEHPAMGRAAAAIATTTAAPTRPSTARSRPRPR